MGNPQFGYRWLAAVGCPVEEGPSGLEVWPGVGIFSPQIIVAATSTVIVVPVELKSWKRQLVDSITLKFPWGEVDFEREMGLKNVSKTRFEIPYFGDYDRSEFLNFKIGTEVKKFATIDGFLVATTHVQAPFAFTHGHVVDAPLQFAFSDGRMSFHNIEIGINRLLASEEKRQRVRRPLFDSAVTEAHDQTNRIRDHVNTSSVPPSDWYDKSPR